MRIEYFFENGKLPFFIFRHGRGEKNTIDEREEEEEDDLDLFELVDEVAELVRDMDFFDEEDDVFELKLDSDSELLQKFKCVI